MKLVRWTDDDVPEVFVQSDGDTVFYDRPSWYGFEVGDCLIHESEIGPSVYRVTKVASYYNKELEYYADPVDDYREITITAD